MSNECSELLPGCAREFGEIRTTQESHGQELSKIVEAVCGNGEPGLQYKVGLLEVAEAARQGALAEQKDNDKWMRRAVIGAVLVLFVKTLFEWIGE